MYIRCVVFIFYPIAPKLNTCISIYLTALVCTIIKLYGAYQIKLDEIFWNIVFFTKRETHI